MRQRLPIAGGLRLVQKIPFVLGILLIWAGLWLLLIVLAVASTGDSVLDGWGLLRPYSSGGLLPVTMLALGLIVIGLLIAFIRPGESPSTLQPVRTAVRVKISAARVPRLRFTLGRQMVWVVISAIASFIALEVWEPFLPRNKTVDILVGLAVSAAFGVGAVRYPRVFLGILVAVWLLAPRIDHPDVNAATLSVGGSFIAWLIEPRLGTIHDCWKGVGSPERFKRISQVMTKGGSGTRLFNKPVLNEQGDHPRGWAMSTRVGSRRNGSTRA